MSFWENFKKTLKTDIRIDWGETVKGGVEASKQVFELAKVLNDKNNLPDVSKLSPYLQQTASSLDVLNSPLGQLVGTTIPFVGIATSLLAFLVKNTQQELSIEASIFLVAQGAYLESFKDFFNKYPEIKAKLKDTKVSEALAKEIKSFGEQLKLNESEAKKNESEANKTLTSFHDSDFAIAANKILEKRLIESGFNEPEAAIITQRPAIITQRISRNTHRFLKQALAENRDKVPKLAAIYGQNWETELKRCVSIDKYLELKESIHFYPCGNPDNEEEFDKTRLLKIIGYSECLGVFTLGFLRNARNTNLRNANLRNTNLRNANLRNANLRNANLSNANLINAKLRNADLSNADLSNADLSNADLSNANLRNADLSNANLRNADLRNADLRNADLSNAILINANLSNAILINANLSNAILINAILINANLINANLINANLINAKLRNANLSNANLSNIQWNEETNWTDARHLDAAKGVSEELKIVFCRVRSLTHPV